MARRRLEAAILAGQAIEQGKELPDDLSRIEDVVERKFEFDHGGIYSMQFSYDGEKLVLGYGNGGIDLMESRTGKTLAGVKKCRYGGLAMTCIRFNPMVQDKFFAGGADGVVYACSLAEEGAQAQECIKEIGNEINCMDFCLDGFNFATAGKDLNVRVYDTQTQQLLRQYDGYTAASAPSEFQAPGHAHRVFALKYHPENNCIFITGGWDNHLKIWDARSRDGVKRTIGGPHICGDSLDIKGYKIITGSWTALHALQLWDYSEGKKVKDVPFPHDGGGEFLYCTQFCDNDIVLAGGSGTNSVKAININTDEVLGEVPMSKPVQALDSCHGGRLFATGGGEERLIISKLA